MTSQPIHSVTFLPTISIYLSTIYFTKMLTGLIRLKPLIISNIQQKQNLSTSLLLIITLYLFCLILQSVVFHVSAHPNYPTFYQCVSFGFFSTKAQEVAYNFFCVMVLYFIPLLVIVVAYSKIIWEIFNKSKEPNSK